ncbi:hypothetical protein J1614_010531 [Plenodomus biglobosus]|nr:hypothetical protein J1614_010531 [Plenodomus biglobosus]
MSVSVLPHITERRPSYQPFQCPICQSRFTRHENLKRHAVVHSRTQGESSLSCEICHTTFSRPDLRLRHVKRKHPRQFDRWSNRSHRTAVSIDERRPQRASPSTSPTDSRHETNLKDVDDEVAVDVSGVAWPSSSPRELSWQEEVSHSEIQNHRLQNFLPNAYELPTVDEATSSLAPFPDLGDTLSNNANSERMLHPSQNMGPAFSFDQWSPDRPLSLEASQPHNVWAPSTIQILRGCELFFTHVSDFLPFLHRPTFDTTTVSPPLLLSMLSLAYQYGEDPDCDNDVGSGLTLSVNCFRQARSLIAAEERHAEDSEYDISMVQTYLLLQIFAMLYSDNEDSAYGLKTHSKMVSLSRASGLMQPLPSEATTTEDLDSLWQHFIQAESRKRTMFAVHQIDTLWYQFLSIPRSLSHLEIKHDLPCPDSFWVASSAGEWAHRQLVARSSSPTIQYQDAVRRVLSSDRDLVSLPAFDPYGTINITQFLVSSAREISGWSTMTGMLSMERLEPLRLSLLALSPLVHAESSTTPSTHTALCEATWQTAMIEMQMWSPSHTGGIVGNSMDAAMHQLVYLAPSLEFLRESNLAKSVQPHVDWFLQYLDATLVPDSEAPWITLYACKAFMIALQLVRGKIEGAMQAVGVTDGDVAGALAWAKQVFRRRERWKLGKIVLSCLDSLDT